MVFGLFEKKKTTPTASIKSEEYLELRSMYDKLRVRVEGLILDIELYKNKLRKSKGLADETEKQNNLNNGLLPDI